jgi:SAM-dependent methyltransferase
VGEHQVTSSDLVSRPRLLILLIKSYRLLISRGPEFLVYKILKSLKSLVLKKNIISSTKEHWDKEWARTQKRSTKLYWWDSPYVVSTVYKRISPEIGNGVGSAAPVLLRKHFPDVKFSKALSIGCGNGYKEMLLIEEGLVDNFDLFELSPKAIEIGKKKAKEIGIEDKITFNNFDPFKSNFEHKKYDLIHWNNSLHHMTNVSQALKISNDILNSHGAIYIEDYVGASRFQWSSENLKIVNRLYKMLPENFKHDPLNPGFLLPKKILRPLAEDVTNSDPTEATDSSNILLAVKKYFPKATIYPLGGAIFHPLLNQCIANFDENNPNHLEWLKKILEVDELSMKDSKIAPHYAIAIGTKGSF